MSAFGEALRSGWERMAWYLNGLTGESKYAAYCAHARSVHPEQAPLSEREFWRKLYAEQDRNPGARCC